MIIAAMVVIKNECLWMSTKTWIFGQNMKTKQLFREHILKGLMEKGYMVKPFRILLTLNRLNMSLCEKDTGRFSITSLTKVTDGDASVIIILQKTKTTQPKTLTISEPAHSFMLAYLFTYLPSSEFLVSHSLFSALHEFLLPHQP